VDDLIVQQEALDSPSGEQLLAGFVQEITSRYPGWSSTIGPSANPDEFVGDRGCFLVAYLTGTPLACGGVKRLDHDCGEIKRLYVVPGGRGKGIARQILASLENKARHLGCMRVCLDTGNNQPEAVALFRSAGYREIGDYNANPYASYWFEKSLAAGESN
jgi:GNAT superfamily N-acetyltransferase